MKKSGFITLTAIAVFLLLGATWASALDPIPQESGFSGFIRPGVGYLSYKSNMVASIQGFDLSEERNDSLSDSPDSETTALVTLPFTLAYTFAGSRTQLFFGTDLTDLIRFDMSQQLGVKQGIGNFGVLQGGFLFSGMPAKVWKDPYLTDADRDDTKRKSTGARLTWDRIFGSWFQVQYTYRKVDIDSDSAVGSRCNTPIARWTSTVKKAGTPSSGPELPAANVSCWNATVTAPPWTSPIVSILPKVIPWRRPLFTPMTIATARP